MIEHLLEVLQVSEHWKHHESTQKAGDKLGNYKWGRWKVNTYKYRQSAYSLGGKVSLILTYKSRQGTAMS